MHVCVNQYGRWDVVSFDPFAAWLQGEGNETILHVHMDPIHQRRLQQGKFHNHMPNAQKPTHNFDDKASTSTKTYSSAATPKETWSYVSSYFTFRYTFAEPLLNRICSIQRGATWWKLNDDAEWSQWTRCSAAPHRTAPRRVALLSWEDGIVNRA
jgi:hypothetical protein